MNHALINQDPTLITRTSPELQQLISEMFVERMQGVLYKGDFVQLLIDPTSITINQIAPSEYKVILNAREDYYDSKWVEEDGERVEDYQPHQFWQYTMIYNQTAGWQVSDYKAIEKEKLSTKDWIPFHSKHFLRIGVDAGLPPFEYIEKNQLRGFDIELIRWLGERLNIKIMLIELPWNQMESQLHTDGEIDGMISAIDSSDIEDLEALYSEPYLKLADQSYVILLRNDLREDLIEINQFIQELHNEYREEYTEMKQKFFQNR